MRGERGCLVLRDVEDQALGFPLLCSLPASCLPPPSGPSVLAASAVFPQHSVLVRMFTVTPSILYAIPSCLPPCSAHSELLGDRALGFL